MLRRADASESGACARRGEVMGSRSPHEAQRNAGLVSPDGTNHDYAKSGLTCGPWDNV